MTGLAIALGINLASSLRNYATLLRWRLLSWSWLTLREFDLVLGCGSLLKIIELMLVTTPRRKFPFVSLIQFLCAVWLFVNVAVQILVAMLGLTYSLDQSPYDVKVLGNVSIVDFSAIVDPAGSGSRTAEAQQFAAHAYGIQGKALHSPLHRVLLVVFCSKSQLQFRSCSAFQSCIPFNLAVKCCGSPRYLLHKAQRNITDAALRSRLPVLAIAESIR